MRLTRLTLPYLACVLMLAGCATQVPNCPEGYLPERPKTSESTRPSAGHYSALWQKQVEDYQKVVQESQMRLMNTPLMQKTE